MKNEASVRICIGWLWAWKRGEKNSPKQSW